MLQQVVDVGEILLLVILTILQLGRWSQKTEDGPSDAIRIAKQGLAKAESTANDLRRHKHAWQNYLNTRFTEYDRTYARKREVELEMNNILTKIDADCDRITELEERIRKFSGV
jgi:peptidoglycan hydrolase CwlO-like protein